MKQKIIIIGAGMGGLFTGALLTKEGYEVTLLEKNTIAGGGLQCFRRGGETFETGMHVLGGFQPGGSLDKICTYLGIRQRLSIVPGQGVMCSLTYGKDAKTYRFPCGKQAFIDYFSREFPAEAENVRRYVERLYALSEEVDLFHLRHGRDTLRNHSEEFLQPVGPFIASYIRDTRLRDVLAVLNPLYAGVAEHTPAYIHALINVLYIEGTSQFAGGSQQLADALCDLIRDGGGRVLCGDAVERVDVEERLVKQVLTHSGRQYTADWYISDIHPCTLLGLTGDHAFPKAYRNRLNDIPNSYSAFTVYIKCKPGSVPFVSYPRYYLSGESNTWQVAAYDSDEWPRGFMCITPPTTEDDTRATRMIVNCIMPFDAVRRWEDTRLGNRGEEYLRWKEETTEKVLQRLEEFLPGIREGIEFSFASSPLTIRDYYGTKEGAIYGFHRDAQNLISSQITIGTKVRNLLLTGQNVNLHGICGVPLTAIEVAEAFVGNGTIIDKINQAYAQK